MHSANKSTAGSFYVNLAKINDVSLHGVKTVCYNCLRRRRGSI